MFQDIKIRTAIPPDYDAIVAIDDISQGKQNRRDFIRPTIEDVRIEKNFKAEWR
jgi:hypothetical protein